MRTVRAWPLDSPSPANYSVLPRVTEDGPDLGRIYHATRELFINTKRGVIFGMRCLKVASCSKVASYLKMGPYLKMARYLNVASGFKKNKVCSGT